MRACLGDDGLLAFTVAADGMARGWDVATGASVTPPLTAEGSTTVDAWVSSDTTRIMTPAIDDAVRIWDMSPDTRPVEDLCLIARVLACRQVNRHGVLVPLGSSDLLLAWRNLSAKYPDGVGRP